MATTTSPDRVLDLIEAYRRSKTMFTAVELGLFERQPQTDAEHRLADACVSLGLLKRDASGRYINSDDADKYLKRDSPDTMTGYIDYSNRVLYRLWGDLEGAVRENKNRWGTDGILFSNFYATDESMRTFLMGMHGFGRMSSEAVVSAFDLSGFQRLIDLGGGTGHLPMAAKQRYPQLSAAVFDLPRVIGFARTIASGIDFLEGDFFTDPLPPADLYALGRILHDWSEDKIRALLAKVAAALPKGGGLLVAERLLDDDKGGPVTAHMQSLSMLICTEGRERTVAEYESLLRDAGFSSVSAKRTGTPIDAILAVK